MSDRLEPGVPQTGVPQTGVPETGAPETGAPETGAPETGALEPGLWESIALLHTWLDENRRHDGQEGLLLRILKLSEEVGEVAQAVIGATGQNPRKGTSHTWDDVQAELCDVIITALVALRGLTPEAQEVFTARLTAVRERSLGTGARATP